MSWYGVITDSGRGLLARYASGEIAINVNKLTVGSGLIADENMRAATNLSQYRDDGAIVTKKDVKHGVDFTFQVGPCAAGSYIAREIGMWANADTEEPVLLALFQNVEGVSIPASQTNPDFAYVLSALLVIDNLDNLSITVDPTAFVTYSVFDPYREEVAETFDTKVDKVDGKELSSNDYTTAEKNKLAGIEENANNYTLPKATENILGGVKVGAGLAMLQEGTLRNSGIHNVTTGTSNGTVRVTNLDGARDVPVRGLGSAAYKNTDSFALASHKHSASDINSGTMAIERGGTGMTANPSGLVNLESESAANLFATSPRPGVSGTLPVKHGGTGLSVFPSALVKLDSENTSQLFEMYPRPGVTGILPVAHGGTGINSNPSGLINLGSEAAASLLSASPRPGVTGILPVAHGGTGANNAASARSNLGAAAANHTHIPNDITGTIPITKGGTGMTANPSVLVNLASRDAANVFASAPRPGITGILPISNGGTGAANATAALQALGAAPLNHTHRVEQIVELPYTIGYFVGDDSTKRKIELGFKPAYLFVFTMATGNEYVRAGGANMICLWPGYNYVHYACPRENITITDPAQIDAYFARNHGGCVVVDGGFFIGRYMDGSDTENTSYLNRKGWQYMYWAWKSSPV